ncbi:hypothetical protein [Sphingomonas flavescens]|jgi:hypothetical protein|uniref:hypothetical protein n=1 Tax=Sphingomonas flavescens TaxID=3132797 RepID=UPI002804B2AF|nr:hypothetical protein [Sphingomonas limnosediminicola]
MNRLRPKIALIGIACGWCQSLPAQGLTSRATARITIRVSVAPRFRVETQGTTVKILDDHRGSALPFTVAEVPSSAPQANFATRLFLIVPE